MATSTIAQPIAQPRDDSTLAPWPIADRRPVVIGPGLSLAYVSSVFRLSINGYRQQFVDLLEELIEKDPHAYSVFSKRIINVSGGRIELTTPKCEPRYAKLAQEICDGCMAMLAEIHDLSQHLSTLAWAVYYAIAGCEIHWRRDGLTGWLPERLSFIHSRRLSYPNPATWDLHVWDLGSVELGQWGPTNGTYGLRIADYPGKFIIHAPQLRGTYPTREGLGREVAYWLVLKLVATRGAPEYLERFARPWPEATYATQLKQENRVASKEDIAAAQAALKFMGAGSLASWVHPDTVTLNLNTPDSGGAAKITYPEWIEICNAEVSKAGLGGTLTTEVGHTGGNRSLGETQKKSEQVLIANDAKLLAATVKRDFISSLVSLNWPNAPRQLVPDVTIHTVDIPDPLKVIEKAGKAAAAGMPVDADKTAAEAGVALIAPGDTKARRMFPIMAIKAPDLFDEDLAARAARITQRFPNSKSDNGQSAGEGNGVNVKPSDDEDNSEQQREDDESINEDSEDED